ncbi:hypothetical protein B0H14DRAFT_3712169 [Mycena olivaceomarginata]|nr:hypothetical protein B0H14DRAFT_3712169 [Mycena olivaceomarginata]
MEPGFYYGAGAPRGDPYPPPPTAQRADLATRNQPTRSLGLGSAPGRSMHPVQRSASLHNVGYNESSDLTPTPARYYSQRHANPIPEEPSQTEVLIDLIQQLRQDIGDVKVRLSAIEAGATASTPPATSHRGLASRRGGRITQAKLAGTRARQRRPAAGRDSGSEAFPIDPELDGSSVTDFSTDMDSQSDAWSDAVESESDLVAFDKLDLTDVEVSTLQSYVTKMFRRVCNVSDSHWPDPLSVRTNEITGETYPSPFFQFQVTDPRNQALFLQVARQAINDLKDEDVWPNGLRRKSSEPKPTWDLALLKHLAMLSFRNLKKNWKRATNDAAAERGKASSQGYRRDKRRQTKSTQISKILKSFGAARNLAQSFLTDLSHEQYLSDEVSGPDDDALAKIKFLEVITPAWRSTEYSNLIHDLEDTWFREFNKTSQKYVRVRLGRPLNRIPIYAPYNFGISTEWLAENADRPETRDFLKGWGTFSEPADCGLIPSDSHADDN